jgi:hypothetical protein
MSLYTVKMISEALCMPRRNVTLVVEQKIVIPRHNEIGRGNTRLFTEKEVVEVYIAYRLNVLGMAPCVIRSILQGVMSIAALSDKYVTIEVDVEGIKQWVKSNLEAKYE